MQEIREKCKFLHHIEIVNDTVVGEIRISVENDDIFIVVGF